MRTSSTLFKLAAAIRAAEFGAAATFQGTQVDGVYSADPRTQPAAERFERLAHDTLLERRLAVMDASAVAIARDNDIDVVVFAIGEKGSLARVLRGEGRFTTVTSTGE